MAVHEFECSKCGTVFEAVVSQSCLSGKKSDAIECPKCKSQDVKKTISKLQMLKDFFCKPSG